ncbi:MAG: cell division protein FtsW [Planctomycetes bacterium]|nr:cell division protein FtsW [Planctomycetota bacterium]
MHNDGLNKEIESNQGVWLFIIVTGLLCLGGLMVFSAGAGLDQRIDLKHFWRISTLRQVVLIPVVWLVMLAMSRLNYRRLVVNERQFWLSPIVFALGAAVVLLVLVLIPGIGSEVNHSRRWLKIGSGDNQLTFQPSELAKWTLVMFLAVYGAYRQEKIKDFMTGFLPAIIPVALVLVLIGKEDFGTAALLGVVCGVILWVAGVKGRHLVSLVPLVALAFYLLVYCNEYRWGRVLVYFQGSGSGAELAGAYQGRQAIMAIGSGQFTGAGLGQGTIKLGWLPEGTTDFIFAVIAEELGFLGVCLVIGLFIAMLVCSMFIVHQSKERLPELLGLAIATLIGGQAAMNLCVVAGLLPTKGISLPFISAGGSGLLLSAAATGILINIARQNQSISGKTQEEQTHGQDTTHHHRRRW